MSEYSSTELMIALLQFFALDADAQLRYASGIPVESADAHFPFGLDHSPLIEMANGTYNISGVLAGEERLSSTAKEWLEEFESVIRLMLCQRVGDFGTIEALRSSVEWRLVRKMSRTILEQMGVPFDHPSIAYDEIIPLIMD